jgi:hypothetical protein
MTGLTIERRQQQVVPAQTHGTMSEMVEQYFRWKDLTVASEHTKKAYHFEVERLMEFIGEDRATTALNSISLRYFSTELCKLGLAPRSRRRALAYARDLIGWAAGVGIYLNNFSISLKLPRLPKSMPQVPTESEVRSLLTEEILTSWLLRMLEATGRIQRQPWCRGITLVDAQPKALRPVIAVEEPGSQFLAPTLLPRSTRKCYDCDAPAMEGKTRCGKHVAAVRESSRRSHRKAHQRESTARRKVWE